MSAVANTTVVPTNAPPAPGFAGNPQTPPIAPIAAPGPTVDPQHLTTEQVMHLVEKARQDEKAKLYKTLETTQSEAKANADRLAKLEAENQQLKILTDKNLPVEERVAKQLESMRSELALEKAERERTAADASKEIHLAKMDAYRHRRLAEVGPEIIQEFVGGETPEHIEASIMVARAEYVRLRDIHRAQFTQEYAHLLQPQVPQPGQPTAGVPAVQSPHYAAPYAGYPSVTNPVPTPVDTGVGPDQIANLTSEEAVRSGAYEQNRARIMSSLRTGGPSHVGSLGTAPRFTTATPVQQYQAAGAAAYQPQGLPTPPVTNPQFQAGATWSGQPHQQFAPPTVPTPYMGAAPDPRAAAMAAIARTNSGQNPLVGQQSHLAPFGGSPPPNGDASAAVLAYNGRFTPTPPVQ